MEVGRVKVALVHPYPVHGRAVGGTTRLDALARYLAPRHRVWVFAHASGDSAADGRAVADMASIGVTQRLFDRPRAGVVRRLRWAAGPRPYYVGHNENPALARALADLDRAEPLDLVHLELGYLAPLLAELSPRPLRVLAEQETMSLAVERLRRLPAREKTLYELYVGRTGSAIRRFESETLPSFDLLFAISAAEAARLSEVVGRPVPVLPHVASTTAFRPPDRESDEMRILFVGNFGHRPNLHALSWFLEAVWPLVARETPGVRLEVVGPHLPESGRQRLLRVGAVPRGRVEDLAGAYGASTVVVNPIRTGGGMRGKVLEAFSCARALVSTSLGMEGIDAEPETHYTRADDPGVFAAAVARYLGSPALRAAHGAAARRLAEERYEPTVVFARLEAAWQRALEERSAARGGRTT
ncbi:MAG TPA: glycosyltransferase family 4 protein [Thermoanaerobaculia bacterium]